MKIGKFGKWLMKWGLIALGVIGIDLLVSYKTFTLGFDSIVFAMIFALGLGFLAGYILSPMIGWVDKNSSGILQGLLWIVVGVLIFIAYYSRMGVLS
jgi:hypothetical protein